MNNANQVKVSAPKLTEAQRKILVRATGTFAVPVCPDRSDARSTAALIDSGLLERTKFDRHLAKITDAGRAALKDGTK